MTDDKADPKTAGECAFGLRPVPRDQPAALNAPNGSAYPEFEGQPTCLAQPKVEAEIQVRL